MAARTSARSAVRLLTCPLMLCNITGRAMDELDRAARRTAINLMRLNEAIDHDEAERFYSTQLSANRITKREERHYVLNRYYRQWFASKGVRE